MKYQSIEHRLYFLIHNFLSTLVCWFFNDVNINFLVTFIWCIVGSYQAICRMLNFQIPNLGLKKYSIFFLVAGITAHCDINCDLVNGGAWCDIFGYFWKHKLTRFFHWFFIGFDESQQSLYCRSDKQQYKDQHLPGRVSKIPQFEPHPDQHHQQF